MTTEQLPSMQTLAPLLDQLREIAQEELPSPRTLTLRTFEDGDYVLVIFHRHSSENSEREQIRYDRDTGSVRWQYLKNPRTEAEFISEDLGTRLTPAFEERQERKITTIEPPTG